MVIAISIFDTLAFLSSGSLGEVSRNIRNSQTRESRSYRRMYKRARTRLLGQKIMYNSTYTRDLLDFLSHNSRYSIERNAVISIKSGRWKNIIVKRQK